MDTANINTSTNQLKDEYINSRLLSNRGINCAYNWISPEVLNNEYPTEASDMYGLCTVIWEIFNERIPYANKFAEEIKCIVTIDDDFNNEKKLVNNVMESVEFPFNRVVADGLSTNPFKRMKFHETRTQLEHHLNTVLRQRVSKLTILSYRLFLIIYWTNSKRVERVEDEERRL